MKKLDGILNGFSQVVGVVRTKGGGHEAAAVRLFSEAFEKNRHPYLIIHKEHLDRSYGPGSEQLDLKNLYDSSMETVIHTKILEVAEAQNYSGSQLEDVWNRHDIHELKGYREQLPNHKIILTLGNDSGASDQEFRASMQLSDLVVLTMYKSDFNSIECISAWLGAATIEESKKILIACCNESGSQQSLEFLSADEFNASKGLWIDEILS